MAQKNRIYKCNICGNLVEVISEGKGELSCCNENMELLKEKQSEEGSKKHSPVLTKEKDKIVATVGEIEHPMEDDHHIVFVELKIGDKIYRENLKPGNEPKAIFNINIDLEDIEDIEAKEYCNIHGLWKSQ